MAGEELLHGGLLEVAVLGDEPVQPAQQPIHIAQCRSDGSLLREAGDTNRDRRNEVPIQRLLCAPRIVAREIKGLEKVEDETGMVSHKVGDIECSVVRPKIHLTVVRLTKRCTAAAKHDARPICDSSVMKAVLASRTHHRDIAPSPVSPS